MPRFSLDILKPLIGQRKSNEPPGLIIVGLGNSGPEYRNTRHNAGFWCIDLLARRHGIKMARGHRTTHLGEGEIRTAVGQGGEVARVFPGPGSLTQRPHDRWVDRQRRACSGLAIVCRRPGGSRFHGRACLCGHASAARGLSPCCPAC